VRKGGEEPYPEVERQEGDGEESTGTTVDDDEDKKNPQGRGNHTIVGLADPKSISFAFFLNVR
jgi:hypothetical protein